MFVLPYARPAQFAAHRAALAPHFSLALDRLVDDAFDRGSDAKSVRTPVMDVSETDAAYTVALEVPGLSREQLKVSVLGRRVTIETIEPVRTEDAARVPTADAAAAPRVLYRERSASRFARTVSLPSEVDQASSQARFDNGVLTLTLAKKVAASATQLSIA